MSLNVCLNVAKLVCSNLCMNFWNFLYEFFLLFWFRAQIHMWIRMWILYTKFVRNSWFLVELIKSSYEFVQICESYVTNSLYCIFIDSLTHGLTHWYQNWQWIRPRGFLQKKCWNKNVTDDNVYFDQANCRKMAKFWMSQVAQSVPARY